MTIKPKLHDYLLQVVPRRKQSTVMHTDTTTVMQPGKHHAH